MIRRILLPLDDSPSAQTATQYAIEMYHRHQAYITTMAIVDQPGIEHAMTSRGIGGSSFARAGREEMLREGEDKAFNLLAQFGELCNQEGIPHLDREVLDGPVHAIIEGSHYVDMIVMGVASCQPFDKEDPTETARMVARETSCAVLTAPDHYRPIRKAVICFNGSVPSARVMQKYTYLHPFDVDELTLVAAGEGDTHLQDSLERAAQYLEAHGHNPSIELLPGSKHDIPDYIHNTDTDLVVLGPHSGKIKAFFFGSLTQKLFRQREVALFMFD